MWLICITMTLCISIDLAYSISLAAFSSQKCTPQLVSQPVSDTFQFIDHFFLSYFWLYPLLYVFWPSTRRIKEQSDYRNSVEQVFLGRDSNTSDTSTILSSTNLPQTSKGFLRLGEPMVESYRLTAEEDVQIRKPQATYSAS